ncbi:MAG TPA: hypothetical protein VFI25_02835 [Planctomycetota bacterium]|nr:hypothetical protein [Planctomycetota bacterium]
MEGRLRDLPASVRAGLSFLLLSILGGFAASAAHLRFHHANRDDRPGLSIDDLRGAYRGIRARAPLLVALERGHPRELADKERQALLSWLRGSRLAEDYDSPELGDAAPAEVLSHACLSCHSRRAGAASEPPTLDFWDDVKAAAVSRDVRPTDAKILAASTHTHALALGSLAILLGALSLGTRWPRPLVHGGVFLLGLSLFLDLASWWLARGGEVFLDVLLVSGTLFNLLSVLAAAGILLDLWLPKRTS